MNIVTDIYSWDPTLHVSPFNYCVSGFTVSLSKNNLASATFQLIPVTTLTNLDMDKTTYMEPHNLMTSFIDNPSQIMLMSATFPQNKKNSGVLLGFYGIVSGLLPVVALDGFGSTNNITCTCISSPAHIAYSPVANFTLCKPMLMKSSNDTSKMSIDSLTTTFGIALSTITKAALRLKNGTTDLASGLAILYNEITKQFNTGGKTSQYQLPLINLNEYVTSKFSLASWLQSGMEGRYNMEFWTKAGKAFINALAHTSYIDAIIAMCTLFNLALCPTAISENCSKMKIVPAFSYPRDASYYNGAVIEADDISYMSFMCDTTSAITNPLYLQLMIVDGGIWGDPPKWLDVATSSLQVGWYPLQPKDNSTQKVMRQVAPKWMWDILSSRNSTQKDKQVDATQDKKRLAKGFACSMFNLMFGNDMTVIIKIDGVTLTKKDLSKYLGLPIKIDFSKMDPTTNIAPWCKQVKALYGTLSNYSLTFSAGNGGQTPPTYSATLTITKVTKQGTTMAECLYTKKNSDLMYQEA